MAIKDTSRKPFIEDNDSNISIGLDLPIRRDINKNGYFASTATTIEAVKVNIKNLLNTFQGERLMQPTIGMNLRKYMFSQITEETVLGIQDDILDTFKIWLPFVEVRDIQLIRKNNQNNISNTLRLNIVFNITQDPNTLASVQVSVPLGSTESPAGVGEY